MKDKILISSKPFEQSIKFGNIYYIGNNLSRDPDYICFLDGYIIDCDFDHYLMIDIFKHEGIKGFNKYQGQFNVIIYNIMSNRLYFTNDFFAPLSLYYYNKSGFFVLSNLFWDVVNLVNPGIADLDIDTVSQFAIYGSLLDKNTIIKNLYIMDTASNYEYNFANNSLVCEKYDDYSSFTEDDMSLDEATDKLQQSILSAVNYVKRKHKGQKIGVCVSGGLDSRILPKLFGKYATYFVITGPKKLKKWCKPYNFSYIDQIADAYGIDINKISQTSTPYEKKLHIAVKNTPLGDDSIGKVILHNQEDFDVLFTSGGHTLLSTAVTKYRNGWSLYDIMEKYQGHRYIKKNRQKSILSLLKFIFINRPNTFQTYNFEYTDFFPVKNISKEEFYNRAHERIDKYTRLKENSKDAIFVEHYDLRVDLILGAFESLSGQVDYAYTSYYPWANKILKHVPNKHLNQRYVLKKLIEKYYPEVATIASEHSIDGIHNELRTSSWKILKAIIHRFFGGCSFAGGMYPNQKAKALELFSIPCSIYDSIFDSESVIRTLDLQEDIFETHLKLKTVLRVIENKEWKKFLN